MTDIDAMSLDELRIAVAQEIMCWKNVTTRRAADGTLTGVLITSDGRRVVDDIPNYPQSIGVVLPLMAAHTDATLEKSGDRWRCVLSAVWQGDGASAAEAICRAALKAIRDTP